MTIVQSGCLVEFLISKFVWFKCDLIHSLLAFRIFMIFQGVENGYSGKKHLLKTFIEMSVVAILHCCLFFAN